MRDKRDDWNPIPKSLRPGRTKVQTRQMHERVARIKAGNDKVHKLRRQYIMVCRMFGLNRKQIAEKLNLGINTVAHEINMAKKDGTLETLNARILAELVPLAIDVYKKKMLDEDDAFVAKDVLKHLDRLTARRDEQDNREEGHMSIQAYIQAKKQLPEGTVTIEQTIKGEAAKAFLEQTTLEPADPKHMDFLDAVVVKEKEDE